MTRLRVLRYPNPCTLRLRSAKGDGLLIGLGGNDSASPRPRDRENHRSLSIYFFEKRECVAFSLTFFSSLRPRRPNDYLLPFFFDRTICESMEKFNGGKIFFFYSFSRWNVEYLCICVYLQLNIADDYSYLSKNENRMENLEKKIFLSILGLWNICINICVNDDYEYLENFRKLKLKFNEKNILTFFFRFLIDGTFNRYNELYKSEM